MSCEDAEMSLCARGDADYKRVERLEGCNLGSQNKNLISDGESEDDSDEDDEAFSYYEPGHKGVYKISQLIDPGSVICVCERSVAEGDSIVKKPAKRYVCTLKEGHQPRDVSQRRACCERILERVVGSRFVSDALLLSIGKSNEFGACLTEDEYRKLCGMDEVAKVVWREPTVRL